jgi:hypothetical protein
MPFRVADRVFTLCLALSSRIATSASSTVPKMVLFLKFFFRVDLIIEVGLHVHDN